jgi:8-oxo-dGTP pyrophosphatase MutT (NUDIX family)
MQLAPVPLRRAVYRAGHAAMRVYWRVVRPHTRGVKCVVREGGALLFVRHAYGDRNSWELPGGGIKRGEDPRDAAAREAREELGIELSDWRALGEVQARGYGKRTTVICFEGRPPDRTLAIDRGEIEEARWFDVREPPRRLGRDARTVLSRLLGDADQAAARSGRASANGRRTP